MRYLVVLFSSEHNTSSQIFWNIGLVFVLPCRLWHKVLVQVLWVNINGDITGQGAAIFYNNRYHFAIVAGMWMVVESSVFILTSSTAPKPFTKAPVPP